MGSNPGLTPGYVPTAAEWNGYFTDKQDDLGFTPLSAGGGQLTGKLFTAATSATLSGFNLPPGTAPSAPINGDMWTTVSGLFVRVNGLTISLTGGAITGFAGGTLTAPLTTAPATISAAGFTLAPASGVPGSPNSGDMWVVNSDFWVTTGGRVLPVSQPARLNTLSNKASPVANDLLLTYDSVGATLVNTKIGAIAAVGLPNAVSNNSSTTFTVGYLFTAFSLGTFSGTVTPAAANGNYQYGTNNGAFTLAAPAADSAMDILVTNGASAGTITFSGYTVGSNTGDALTTSNGSKFIVSIRRINGTSTYVIKALQ